MTPDTYFDHYQALEREPPAIGGLTDLAKVYSYQPVPPGLDARVLGSQFQLWTEYMPTPPHVESMAFPRACAFAEVVWSGVNDAFDARLEAHLGPLSRLGVKELAVYEFNRREGGEAHQLARQLEWVSR
jgi:hexosaminidase